MRTLLALLLLAPLALVSPEATAQTPGQWTQHVDPFIGTGGTGHTFPGATTPFGMVQLSPDTRIDDSWEGCAGYYYDDQYIYGFSHTHLSGTGISDYGDVMFMPTMGSPTMARESYRSDLDHSTEEASPGYYAVTLDSGIRVELTATTRVGLQRYTFPRDGWANVVLDLTHRDKLMSGKIEASGAVLTGHRISKGWAEDQRVFFRSEFSRTPEAVYERAGPEGDRVFIARFRVTEGEQILIKTGIAGTDEAGAARNLTAELPGWDFDATRAAADAAWNAELGKIDASGGSPEATVNFYTALYHTMIAPNTWTDGDGRYRGRDGAIHTADHTVYTVFSLWDTFRALHPLLTLIDEDRTRDFVRTMLLHHEQSGRLPVWELAADETDTMIGYHAVPVILDAAVKGIGGFDEQQALRAMVETATTDIEGLTEFNARGFLSVEDESESVSRSLEYAYNAWVVARMAERLDDRPLAAEFDKRSLGYRSMLDARGFARPRQNGGWLTPFEPREVNSHFTEANSWQYSFFVPHDLSGWIEWRGGPLAVERHLDSLFVAPEATTGRDQADITGLIGQYAHGNEPSHGFAYLYAATGSGWKTQRRVRQILDDLYVPAPDGLPGNEDCGQMSAWFVFSAMGFYPVTPGTTTYALGTPLFETVRLQTPDGGTFTITGDPARGPYVQHVALHGAEHRPLAIDHADLRNGGTLAFTLGAEPSDWGTPMPLTRVDDAGFVPAPVIQAQRSFRDSQPLALASLAPEARRHRSLVIDGMSPDRFPPPHDLLVQVNDGPITRYSGPLALDTTSVVTAWAVDREGNWSAPARGELIERPNAWTIALGSTFAPHYAGASDDALIDGIRADAEWRKGDWQGFYDQDLIATVDFRETRTLNAVYLGVLQDSRPWILFPREVIFEASGDGVTFREILRVKPTVTPRDETPQIAAMGGDLKAPEAARFLRVRALPVERLPDWHLGAGNPAWIFADEIWVE